MSSQWHELCNVWPLDPTKGAKRQLRESDKPMKVSHLQFGMLKPHEMQRVAHLQVVNRELYQQPSRVPQPFGPLDLRLGASSKVTLCETCGRKLADCVGHFGVVDLELPVFHIGYFKTVMTLLQCICKVCARTLIYEAEAAQYLARMRAYEGKPLQQRQLQKLVIEKCKRMTRCAHCDAVVGSVKKAGALKIVHERFRSKRDDGTEELYASLEAALAANKELEPLLSKVQDTITPAVALSLLQRLSTEDCEMLSMRPLVGRPEEMILTKLLVPPVCIRPSVTAAMTSGSNEDDLTIKIGDIVHINTIIKDSLSKGSSVSNVQGLWDFMQLQVASYINSELPGVPASVRQSMKSRKYTGLCQRMKGKTGRFRGNLSGKRVDFSSRTVISPDPNMSINEVVMPALLAKVLTYPQTVCAANRAQLQEAVRAGPDGFNGANFIVERSGAKKYLKYTNRHKVALSLRDGDVVERHVRNGDVVLFNRQPSLHKVSIMSHRVRVMPWRTFRFNVCVCSPYNADFDGDEMNLHVPQTEESRAEASVLMGVENNLVTPRSGEPLIAAIQDFITCTYLVTHKDMFLDKAQFCQACTYFADAAERIVLPPPAILKPVELWTGKQVFSVLLNPAANYSGTGDPNREVTVNLSTKNKSYSKAGAEMCPSDGWTLFYNSQLLAGVVDKAIVGSGSKASLFYVIERDNSPAQAARAMQRLAKFSARWLASYGFSIGISDVTPSASLVKRKAAKIADAYAAVDELIAQFGRGELVLQAGCSAEQTLENKITKVLSDVRGECGDICLAELKPTNAPLIMTMCGSKGSNINISQMVACVGQQTVSGSRIPNGFLYRTLPMFEKNSRIPAAKGFCANSFYSGLNPTEFFFHTMGGREGLVDTAVKTADTGYMQRRLMKALEDLSVQYDGTVRNSVGSVIQFRYGDDCLDPSLMEGDSKPVNFERTFSSARVEAAVRSRAAAEAWLLPRQMLDRLSAFFAAPDMTRLGAGGSVPRAELVSEKFLEDLRAFMIEKVDELAETRARFGLDPHTAAEPGSALAGVEHAVGEAASVMPSQLDAFLTTAFFKYRRAEIEPGSAVGALGAQSIGEPGTQMTLKTFHFAGVASMNITLGVPRIREIINASKNISTPIIKAPLLNPDEERAARIVKGRVEKTTLGEIASEITAVYARSQVYMLIRLDDDRIRRLQLDVSVESVAAAILAVSKLKLTPDSLAVDRTSIRITPAQREKESLSAAVQTLKNKLSGIVVCGIPSVDRAIISKDAGKHMLMVDGIDLQAVMGIKGIDAYSTTSNHIIEVERTLGIEAARQTIMNEIDFTMSSHGMSVDQRHLMLLADLMSFRGEILGITRFGIGKMKNSTLMLASFEKTMDILFDAAVRHRVDAINGVSECIIMGVPVSIGSGAMKVHYNYDAAAKELGTAGRKLIRPSLALAAH
ncbi:DNA-directed RNA polymerase [Thecamonas trahens ATCC 50062]|uniref:DNA-directed RNA polymerase subunit n=1 Tax=Thecamonas trahens ATCC 50062 TaxID=461836 RepID=A0A0L0DJG1_THETB|nr:DNA-directed RNA polymerase [Thecamonas trahens ATCC 50062]KNC52211.1 DNA-directed RNA polymerase [Thecamonas trahens ATCC 50062]|eukprot:XP_013762214.1 DNA-directed RNA polymerase [Thecamonas trahens ATCC 50062]